MLYNVLSYNDPNEGKVIATNIAPQGLSDFLFNNGVRILAPALTREEVRGFIQRHDITYDHIDYSELVERVTSNSDYEPEPGRAWKNLKETNKWDNEKDPIDPIY
jgi:hypothetical protein